MMIYGVTVIVATFFASLAFVLLYGFTSGWFRSRMGRHLMWFSIVVTLTYFNTVLRLIFPGLPYRMETQYVIATMVFLVVAQRLSLMIRVLIKDRRDYREAQKETQNES